MSTLAEEIYAHARRLPEPAAREALAAIRDIERRWEATGVDPATVCRRPGTAADAILWIAEDFDAPLDDFRDYAP